MTRELGHALKHWMNFIKMYYLYLSNISNNDGSHSQTQLLHATSFYPQSCKNSIIYSQALRYCRIIINTILLDEQLERLRKNLFQKGHELTELTDIFRKPLDSLR